MDLHENSDGELLDSCWPDLFAEDRQLDQATSTAEQTHIAPHKYEVTDVIGFVGEDVETETKDEDDDEDMEVYGMTRYSSASPPPLAHANTKQPQFFINLTPTPLYTTTTFTASNICPSPLSRELKISNISSDFDPDPDPDSDSEWAPPIMMHKPRKNRDKVGRPVYDPCAFSRVKRNASRKKNNERSEVTRKSREKQSEKAQNWLAGVR
ncbi:hypothetical protein EJ02DRAFT_456250 [Clathrospora elynae]|uniref:Uncharacterized protein n=1 Tax=Clathrospora elynae TaxID=706981 RepID=A0A6A5SKP5_9PLEO|nr:hypothetical protein EJ02DRAFT_456250 [Clathrospora elynae]